MNVAISIIVLWLFISCLIIGKTSRILNLSELKRRARGTHLPAYTLFAYESGLKLFVWLVGSATGTVLLIKTTDKGWWLTLLYVLIVSWLIFAWHPKKANAWYWSYCGLIGRPIIKLLSFIQPLASKLERPLSRLWPLNVHSGVFEAEDLLKLIKDQKDQPENRIPETDLRAAYGALSFGDKKVADVMTPRRKMKMVAADDAIGAGLLDDLHSSGFSRFPVVAAFTKSASVEVIGTLFLRDLIKAGEGGKVKDVMQRDACFINESSSLRQTLDGFMKTRHHMLVVVNNFEEIVGVITIEDVVEQIMGTKILDDFDDYQDLRAVAAAEAKKEQAQHQEVKPAEQTE
jgi:CBS domain containing-hemolysin-like protein